MALAYGIPRGQFFERHTKGVAAGATIEFGDALMVNAAGYVERCAAGTAGIACGFARQDVDNTAGADGDESVDFESGKALVRHDGTISLPNAGTSCAFVDHLNVTGAAPAAGEPGGVVYFDPTTYSNDACFVLVKWGN